MGLAISIVIFAFDFWELRQPTKAENFETFKSTVLSIQEKHIN